MESMEVWTGLYYYCSTSMQQPADGNAPEIRFNSTKQSLGQSDPSAVIRRGWREEALANQMSSSGGDSQMHTAARNGWQML